MSSQERRDNQNRQFHTPAEKKKKKDKHAVSPRTNRFMSDSATSSVVRQDTMDDTPTSMVAVQQHNIEHENQ